MNHYQIRKNCKQNANICIVYGEYVLGFVNCFKDTLNIMNINIPVDQHQKLEKHHNNEWNRLEKRIQENSDILAKVKAYYETRSWNMIGNSGTVEVLNNLSYDQHALMGNRRYQFFV